MKVNKINFPKLQNTTKPSFTPAQNAISTNRSSNGISRAASTAISNMAMSQVNKPYAIISFKGKNTNKEQVAFVGAECPPYCKTGGVGTVMNDYKAFSDKGSIFIPYYNGSVTYDGTTGEPKGKPVVNMANINGELTPIYTAADLDKQTPQEVVDQGKEGKDYFILETIKTGKMTFGTDSNVDIGLYKVKGENHYMVYTPQTAAMKKPYAGGIAYASDAANPTRGWNGDAYAEFDKAFVELLPHLEDTFSPETVICSDAQCAYIPEYMAKKTLEGNEFYDGMKPSYVGHNVGKGYIGYVNGRQMFVNMGATPEEIKEVEKDPDYFNALQEDKLNDYFKGKMEKVYDASSKCFSPTLIPLKYAADGYLSHYDVVAEDYAQAIAENPKVSPALHNAGWGDLYNKKRVGGILNPLNDKSLNPYKTTDGALPEGYAKPLAITKDGKLAIGEDVDGKTVYKVGKQEVANENIEKTFEPFIPFKKNGSLAKMKEVKNHNKAIILERLTPENNKYPDLIHGFMNGRFAKIIGGIDPQYVEKVKNGEDVKLFVSWGRADFQKGFDITIDAFKKFAKTEEGKNAVIVLGASMTGENNGEIEVINKSIKSALEDPDLKGRFVFIDGFAPAKALSSAGDGEMIMSRFEPCGLTDLEGMKYFCTPIVANTQGLAQKNFDPRVAGEETKALAYKTTHEYLLKDETIKEIRDAYSSDDEKKQASVKKEFKDVSEEVFTEFGNTYKKLFETEKARLAKRGVQSEKIGEIAERNALASSAYKDAEHKLCNNILVDEAFEALKAFSTRDIKTQNKMYKNQANLTTDWDSKTLHPDGKSTRELYQERQIDPDPVKPTSTILPHNQNNDTEVAETAETVQTPAEATVEKPAEEVKTQPVETAQPENVEKQKLDFKTLYKLYM